MGVGSPVDYDRINRWGAWAPYTPTLTSTSGGNPVTGAAPGGVYGRMRRDGSRAACRGVVQFTATSTFGSGGEWRISLPTDWVVAGTPANAYQEGHGLCVPTAGAAYSLLVWAQPGTTYLRVVTNAAIPASVNNSTPASWTASASNWLSWHIADLELADPVYP